MSERRNGVLQRAGELEIFGRVCQVDHLLIIRQLQAVEAGLPELRGEQVMSAEFLSELRMGPLVVEDTVGYQPSELFL